MADSRSGLSRQSLRRNGTDLVLLWNGKFLTFVLSFRRGEHISDEEEELPKAARKAKAKAAEVKEARQQWKKPPKRKTVVHHRTFEEIMEEAGQEAGGSAGLGVIIDATGATVCASCY